MQGDSRLGERAECMRDEARCVEEDGRTSDVVEAERHAEGALSGQKLYVPRFQYVLDDERCTTHLEAQRRGLLQCIDLRPTPSTSSNAPIPLQLAATAQRQGLHTFKRTSVVFVSSMNGRLSGLRRPKIATGASSARCRRNTTDLPARSARAALDKGNQTHRGWFIWIV